MKKIANFIWGMLLILGALLGLSLPACSSTQKATDTAPKLKLGKNASVPGEDSVEYELIVLDPRYESWLATQPPANFYSQQYYENWNHRYVTEWNHRHNHPLRYGNFYETYIDYDPSVDYGLELNYRLYNYFRFIEHAYGIVLIPRGR